jgi:hypothetical protein
MVITNVLENVFSIFKTEVTLRMEELYSSESLVSTYQTVRCALFKAYTGERSWKAVGDRLQRPCYLRRVDHDRKVRSRKQKTDIGKYSSVNGTIQLWKQLPADALGTLSCKPSNFRKGLGKW